jgi:hypothetical protein
MFKAVPEHFYAHGTFILLSEDNICSIQLVYSREKKLKNTICWLVNMSNGESWTIKESEYLDEVMPISPRGD